MNAIILAAGLGSRFKDVTKKNTQIPSSNKWYTKYRKHYSKPYRSRN
ncbi:CTP:phosphocholine cytidylyltransferase involved in choline phosphorylation for cell surface LPS epitopes [Pasteurella multocida]|nr:CTP:phosphocholine cytidylyltransferase involved in choline phosphorylation for cell surface LPS epitopes [Pasteurella multocida]